MSKVVFISHAGVDLAKAATVANLLQQANIEARYNREELRIGDSFLTFIESALSDADYCLLLWSKSAARTEWVRLEWEAALYKSVAERRSFLVAGRIEDIALPTLLAPRIRVDLFPNWQPGIGQVIDSWQADRNAEAETGRPVANVPLEHSAINGQGTVYVTSDLFGITVPMKTNLQDPAGVYLDKIVTGFGLPRVFDHAGRLGVNFDYRFIYRDKPLDRAKSLMAQDVRDMGILWLETTMIPYAQIEAVKGAIRPTVFRGNSARSRDNELGEVKALAREIYAAAILRSGLGSMKRPSDEL